MGKKVFGLVLAALLFALGFPAEAQQPKKIPRIGFVTGGPTNTGPHVEAFRRGLQDLGYIEGKNILVEYRDLEGKPERSSDLVAELVQLNVDVIVVSPITAIRAAKQATKKIPIVMMTLQDPVAVGLVDSLARPGGNITGLNETHPRTKWKTSRTADRSDSGYIACRNTWGCKVTRFSHCL
jgi:putative tryptophan/tyrosine transport system substrate-binding protein